jgi:hypothetical protein
MCFETLQQLNWFVYGAGFATPIGLVALWRFAKWAVISGLRYVVGKLHSKLNPEIDRRSQNQQQPQRQQQQPQGNPNKGQNNQSRRDNGQGQPQNWQQPQHQVQGPTLNA